LVAFSQYLPARNRFLVVRLWSCLQFELWFTTPHLLLTPFPQNPVSHAPGATVSTSPPPTAQLVPGWGLCRGVFMNNQVIRMLSFLEAQDNIIAVLRLPEAGPAPLSVRRNESAPLVLIQRSGSYGILPWVTAGEQKSPWGFVYRGLMFHPVSTYCSCAFVFVVALPHLRTYRHLEIETRSQFMRKID